MSDFDGEDVVLIGGKALSRTIILAKLSPQGWTREDVAHMNDEEVRAALGGAKPGQLVLADDPARRKVDLKVITGETGKRVSAHVDLLNENQPPTDGEPIAPAPGQPRIIIPGAPRPTIAAVVPQPSLPPQPAFSPHARPAPPAPIPMPAPALATAAAFSPHATRAAPQSNLQFPTAPAPAPAPRPWTPPVPPAQPVAPMSALPAGVPPCRYNHMQLRSVMDAVAQLALGGDSALPVARNLLETHNLSDAFRSYNPAVWQLIYPGVQPTAHEWCLGGVLMTIDGGSSAFHLVTTDGVITIHGQNLQIVRS